MKRYLPSPSYPVPASQCESAKSQTASQLAALGGEASALAASLLAATEEVRRLRAELQAAAQRDESRQAALVAATGKRAEALQLLADAEGQVCNVFCWCWHDACPGSTQLAFWFILRYSRSQLAFQCLTAATFACTAPLRPCRGYTPVPIAPSPKV